MTEFIQDQAALYAMGLLDPEECRALEQMMASDPELDLFVRELQDTIAMTVQALPTDKSPPPALKTELMSKIRQGGKSTRPAPLQPTTPVRSLWGGVAWSIAAALALSAAWLFTERTRLEHSLAVLAENEARASRQADDALQASAQLRTELDRTNTLLAEAKTQITSAQSAIAKLTEETNTLRQRDARAQMQIATLQSTVDEYRQGVAVVVWDSEKQEGILKLEKMPPVEVSKDYQLWVVDPNNPKPVNAGIVKVDADGFAKIDFKPVIEVSSAAKFALSVEREGGVPENEGPIILIGP